MAQIITRHEPHELIEVEMYDKVYETRPYISGGMFFGFGSVNTEYKKDLVSYKEREIKTGRCACGLPLEDKIHDLIVYADKFSPHTK